MINHLMADKEKSSPWHRDAGQATARLLCSPADIDNLKQYHHQTSSVGDQDGPRQKPDHSITVWNTNAQTQKLLSPHSGSCLYQSHLQFHSSFLAF